MKLQSQKVMSLKTLSDFQKVLNVLIIRLLVSVFILFLLMSLVPINVEGYPTHSMTMSVEPHDQNTHLLSRWSLPDWQEWLASTPILKLRPLQDLWKDAPFPSVQPRLRIQYLELPALNDLKHRWNQLPKNSRDPSNLMVVGDSISATDHYLRCFQQRLPSGPEVTPRQLRIVKLWRDLGKQGVTLRDSYAAQPGATTWELTEPQKLKIKRGYGKTRVELKSAPQELTIPLMRELYDNPARFALVTLGTNDLNYHRGIERFSAHYLQIVQTLIDMGVLPILSTIPPQLNKRHKSLPMVHEINQIIETIAQVEQLPLIHLYQALYHLKNQGLRADGIHLNAYQGGCQLNQHGLKYGQNLRNQLTLHALETLQRLLEIRPLDDLSCESHHQPSSFPSTRSLTQLPNSYPTNLVFKAQKIRLSHVKTVMPNYRLSIVSEHSPLAPLDQSSTSETCAHKIRKRAAQATQWNQMLTESPDLLGPPRKEHGTWREQRHSLNMKHQGVIQLQILGELGRRTDLRHEQFWIALEDHKCIKLHVHTQQLNLPRGEHQLIHYARLQPALVPSQQKIPKQNSVVSIHHYPQTFISRAVFSWNENLK